MERQTESRRHKLRNGRRRSARRGHAVGRRHERNGSQKPDWEDLAYKAGEHASTAGADDPRIAWAEFMDQLPSGTIPWEKYARANGQFAAGFAHSPAVNSGFEREAAGLWMPVRRTVGVIVTVMNEDQVVKKVIDQLNRLPFDELIFVVNGSTDHSYELIRRHARAIILHYDEPVGHDVGRALGANVSQSDILLFLDGDFPVAAEHLVPFIHAVGRGMDVALNHIDQYVDVFSRQDHVTRVKTFLNRLVSRPDLGSSSLTAVPHAMSRTALQQIGVRNLIVPPLAQVRAIRLGLAVGVGGSVDVIHKNKIRETNVGSTNPVADLILGDHAEALAALTAESGSRLHYQDVLRDRAQAGVGQP